ncbi:hypothetical protein R3Q06_36760, partial [Rhodococcus erythropolis]|uniref:hypothetical protein n=1 Tax=Rhodococcus erythropolis TaxID=1833 RepID=UPI0029494655
AEHLDHYRRYRTAEMHTDQPAERETAVTQQHHDHHPGKNLAGFCMRLAHTLPAPPIHVIFDTEPPEWARSELSTNPHIQIHHSPTPMTWLHLVDVSISLADRSRPNEPH